MSRDDPAWESLSELDEAGEVLWCGGPRTVGAWRLDEVLFDWRRAHARARAAYAWWCREPGRAAYAVYRAAQDQADAAHLRLARHRHV